nr:S24 family peptidase [Deinococcus arboris]
MQASVPEAPVADDGLAWEGPPPTLVLTPTQYRPHARAMLVIGHSMDDGSEQAIRHGDIVLVDPRILGSVYHNTRNTVISTRNGYIVKERGLVNGKHLLVSRNPDYPPIKFDPEWRMEGVVYARYLGKKQVKFL